MRAGIPPASAQATVPAGCTQRAAIQNVTAGRWLLLYEFTGDGSTASFAFTNGGTTATQVIGFWIAAGTWQIVGGNNYDQIGTKYASTASATPSSPTVTPQFSDELVVAF